MKKIKYLLVLFHIIFLSPFVLAQPPASDSLALVEKANDLLQQAAAMFQVNLDSAGLLIDQALPLYREAELWENYVASISGLATVHYYRNDFEQFKLYSMRAVKEAARVLGEGHPRHSEALNNLALLYQKRGDYDQTLRLLNQSLSISNQRDLPKMQIAACYKNIAITYVLKEDFRKGLDYLQKTLEIYTDSLASNDPKIGISYKSIGMNYRKLMEYDSALVYLEKGLDILQNSPQNKSKLVLRNTITTLQGMAEVWVLKKEPQRAETYLQRVLKLQDSDAAFRKAFSYELLAKKYKLEKNYAAAAQAIQTANRLAQQNYRNNSYPIIARKLLVSAEIFQLQGQLDSALHYTQSGLRVLAPDYQFSAPFDNPPIDQLLAKTDALSILVAKAQYLREIYQTREDTSALAQSLDTYHTATDLIRHRRLSKLSQLAKIQLAEQSITVYEGAIAVAMELYQRSGKAQYIEEALLLAEHNKALLLLESINEEYARGYAALPDSLLQKEESLRIDLAFYQKKILEEKQKEATANADKLKILQDRLFEFQKNYDVFINDLEKNYPRYFQLKYEDQRPSLAQLRSELLEGNNALLEFFMGKEELFLFCLTQKELYHHRIKTKDLDPAKIQALLNFISTPPTDGLTAAELRQFQESAYEHYRLLLAPVLEALPDAISQLVIIPDGLLASIPFDVLWTQAPSADASSVFNSDFYLLQSYAISYDYSATLLLKNRQRQFAPFKGDLVAYAPAFSGAIAAQRSCNQAQLSRLKCNQEEAEQIGILPNSRTYTGSEASSDNFKQLAQSYRVIHLATHACVDRDNPALSKIYFSEEALSLADVYHTRLNTELVVLSACNTGVGRVVEGEGVMSIARGFMAAGSPSTMLSLWSVDDCSTAELMREYYQNLQLGETKGQALQKAKLSFIANAPKTNRHPFYWGAFVQFGNTNALQWSSGYNWRGIIGGSLLGLLLLFLFVRFRAFIFTF